MKEQAIKDYLSKINFNKDWSYSVLEENMRKFLGERPSLEISYVKDVMLNEVSGEAKEVKRINSIKVVFTDGYDRDGRPIIKNVALMV